MSKHQFKGAAQDHAAYNFATEEFFDFSEETFVALALDSTNNARGGNGGGNGGGKKDKPSDPVDPPTEDPPTEDPVDPPVDTSVILDSYISGSDDGTGYNIEIQFIGDGWTVELQQAFIASADIFSAIIVGDRPDYIAADDGNNFFNQDIDDILITASLTEIDGVGGILGRAGPTHIIYDPVGGETSSQALPFAGQMEFDVADAENYLELGTWDDIVFHEMAHTLGFGTMWESTGVVDVYVDDNGTRRPIDDTLVYDYTGEYASSFTDDPSTEAVEGPVIETDGGSGTAGGHWDEDTYGNELMTGYINGDNYLSQMSMASFADLGYVLNWEAPEYTLLAENMEFVI